MTVVLGYLVLAVSAAALTAWLVQSARTEIRRAAIARELERLHTAAYRAHRGESPRQGAA